MSLIRRNPYDPFYDMNRMMDHMRTVMNSVFVPFEGELLSDNTNTLAVDMSSDESNIVVRTVLPGFKEDEVNIDVQGKVLTISAESKAQNDNQQRLDRRRQRRQRRLHFVLIKVSDLL